MRKALLADTLSDQKRAGVKGGFHDGGCATSHIYTDYRTENYCSPSIRYKPWFSQFSACYPRFDSSIQAGFNSSSPASSCVAIAP
jgi:hypothetical protein